MSCKSTSCKLQAKKLQVPSQQVATCELIIYELQAASRRFGSLWYCDPVNCELRANKLQVTNPWAYKLPVFKLTTCVTGLTEVDLNKVFWKNMPIFF